MSKLIHEQVDVAPGLRNGEYGPPKTKAGTRRIALPADVREELVAFRLRSSFSRDEHPVWASRTGTPLGHRNVTRRGFELAAEKAGLAGVTFHDLRHAAASRLIDAGLDPVTVASVLGHEDASITLKVYAHRFNRQSRDEAVRSHSPQRPSSSPREQRTQTEDPAGRGGLFSWSTKIVSPIPLPSPPIGREARLRAQLKSCLRARSSAGEHSLHTRAQARTLIFRNSPSRMVARFLRKP
jgi:hypothetical protein